MVSKWCQHHKVFLPLTIVFIFIFFIHSFIYLCQTTVSMVINMLNNSRYSTVYTVDNTLEVNIFPLISSYPNKVPYISQSQSVLISHLYFAVITSNLYCKYMRMFSKTTLLCLNLCFFMLVFFTVLSKSIAWVWGWLLSLMIESDKCLRMELHTVQSVYNYSNLFMTSPSEKERFEEL